MSLAEGDRTNRDDQLDLSLQLRKDYGENIFIGEDNEQHYRRIKFHAEGGLGRLPKCLQGSKRKMSKLEDLVEEYFPCAIKRLNIKFKNSEKSEKNP